MHTAHRQGAHPSSHWHPPGPLRGDGPFSGSADVQSVTECTGLTPAPPQTREEAESFSSLEGTLPLKDRGDIGRDNPLNDPTKRRILRRTP